MFLDEPGELFEVNELILVLVGFFEGLGHQLLDDLIPPEALVEVWDLGGEQRLGVDLGVTDACRARDRNRYFSRLILRRCGDDGTIPDGL